MAVIDARVSTTKRGNDASADAQFALRASERPTLSQQRADALVQCMTTGGSTVNTEVIVHVRGDGLRLNDGTPIGTNPIAQVIPRATIRAMIHDANGHPINVSGKHRLPTRRQELVVNERQPTCECGATAFLEYHHEPPFAVSHRTVVDELERKCGHCHRLRHRDDRL